MVCCFVTLHETVLRDLFSRAGVHWSVGAGSLVTASVQVFNHPGKTYVQKSDLTVEVVHLLLKAAVAVSSPVKSNRPCHKVDCYNKAERQDCVLWVTFILLEDVHT